MVQRYEIIRWGLPEMAKYPYGGYVEYDIYKELESRLEEVNAELQKYKDQFPDYVECANCGSVTHVEGVGRWVVFPAGAENDTRN